MAKKLNLKFSYDAPVSQSFVLISLVIFILDFFVLNLKLNQNYLLTPTPVFSIRDPLVILRTIIYIFGETDKVYLFTNLLFIILIGPVMEERYGSVIIGIMFFVAAFVTGSMSACFCKVAYRGCSSVVFMLLLLNAMMFFTKKTISATSITMVVLFICREFFIANPNGVVGTLIILAGGLAGSLFAFIASPKARKTRKENSGGLLNKAERLSKIDSEPTKTKKKPAPGSSDETIEVGTLKF